MQIGVYLLGQIWCVSLQLTIIIEVISIDEVYNIMFPLKLYLQFVLYQLPFDLFPPFQYYYL